MYFMGIDIGTYESKGVLTDDNARVVACQTRPHAMESPRPGWAEHDAETAWWGDLCAISRALLAEAGVAPEEVAALAVSAIAPCCLPVDGNMRPLRKAILYGVDVRAAKEIEALNREIGAAEILARYGAPLTSQSAGAKVLWLKNNEPDIYRQAAKFVTGSTYLVAKLTGECVIDRYTAATWVPLYDLGAEDWEGDLRGICRREQLAECRWTDETAGFVTAEAARATGLAVGTRVTVGTADAGAEALSVGVTRPGRMMLMYGSSIFIIHVVEEMVRDERLWAGPYLFRGTYAVTAGMSCTGTLTRWFRDNFAPDILEKARAGGREPYEMLAELAEGIPAGAEGLVVLPYFSGERTPINDPRAKGLIFGLNLHHTRGHVYKALLEGVGYGVAQHFAIFRELGMRTERVMAVGGGTKNAAWLQAVSDIGGQTQLLAAVGIGAAYGDAMLAALAAGRYKGPEELDALVRVKGVVEPNPANRAVYDKLSRRYGELYRATSAIMHEE